MFFFQLFPFRKTSQFFIDLFIFLISWFVAYILRFEGFPAGDFQRYMGQMIVGFPLILMARILVFYSFSVYAIIWRYISIRDAFVILKACIPPTLILVLLRFFAPSVLSLLKIPISVIATEFLLVVFGTSGARVIRRITSEARAREALNETKDEQRRKVLLVGAGDAGNVVLRELQQRIDLGLFVVGFVDDDQKKLNKTIHGVNVLGNTKDIPELSKRLLIEEVIITIANASSKDIRRIVEIATAENLKIRIIPGLFEMLDEKIKITKVREINIDDLLGRSFVQMEEHLPVVSKTYRDKRILVTGAGGSIGSELCHQLLAVEPLEIVLLDKDENSIFEIDSELKGTEDKKTKIQPIIANIKNYERMAYIFERYTPEVVFHAAAHKHVPLMEHNVQEAIINNVLGTKNVVDLAGKCGVERFIFISTDKAVNPTNVMGATKKIGEIVVQDVARASGTKFSCVRFGNVIGSRGSAIPLFQRQIAKGGPVTVTHPDVRRYFMSIAEAVHLIIQAGTLGENGEIFVLDMGEPIKITDMVKELIRLSGHGDGDIEIKYIGLRPGEKLYEEILIDEERAKATHFEKIFIAPPADNANGGAIELLGALVDAARKGDDSAIKQCLVDMRIGYNKSA